MQYMPGDKVLVVDAQQDIDGMQKFIGSVVTIETVNDGTYTIVEDPVWLWTERYFSDLCTTEISIDENDMFDIFKG